MRTIRSPFVLGFLLLLAAPWAAVFAVGPKLDFEDARKEMVDEEIVKAGVKNARVIQSMASRPVGVRPPWTTTSQRPGWSGTARASTEMTTH